MSARLARDLGVALLFLALGVLWAAPSPVPGGAAILVALLAIGGIILLDKSGVTTK